VHSSTRDRRVIIVNSSNGLYHGRKLYDKAGYKNPKQLHMLRGEATHQTTLERVFEKG
jgi:hypothetical protein